MTDVELAAAALVELKQTVRGLSGYSPPPRSHWGKALDSLGQVTIDTKSRDMAVSELRMTTVGYDYFVKKGVTPGPGSHWGKALAYIAEIGVTLKVTVSAPSGTLAGTVTVSASVTPPNQADTVTRVEFYVDSTLKATDTTVPYSFSWDTTTASDSSHQLKAKVFYPVNKVTEGLLTVSTNNTVTPPPPPPPGAPPVNTTLPTISGTATEGQTLSVSMGTWTNSPTSYTRQWLRCDAAGTIATAPPIAGATGSSYTLVTADVGGTIRCAVIAYNAFGASPQVITAQTAVVTALTPAVPVNTSVPIVSGSATQGSTLSVSNGVWTNNPSSYTYQWQSCGSTTIGETSVLAVDDSGNGNVLVAQSATLAQAATIQSLSFYVTVAAGTLRLGIYDDAGGRPGTKLAETTGFVPVAGWNTQNVVTPVALTTGTYWIAYLSNSDALAFKNGTSASSSLRLYAFAYGTMPATFSTTPTSDPVHFSFYANVTPTASCANISGQTAYSHVVSSADVGKTLRAAVKGVNASGTSAAAYSAATATVAALPAPPPPPTGEPAPIAGQGYTLRFSEDFNTLDTNVWRLGGFWTTQEDPADVFVAGGVLNIVNRQSAGFPGRICMTRTLAWKQGYFEARMRWTADANSFPSIYMMSDNWMRTNDCTSFKISEFDIMETFETNYPRSFSGALHRNTLDKCGLADELNGGLGNTWVNDVGFDLAHNWHVYSGLWTTTEMRWYIDGIEMIRCPAYSTTDQPMRLLLQMDSHAPVAGDLVTEVDWVHVWQK